MAGTYQYNDTMVPDLVPPSNRLKDWRSRRGWTQVELARRAGISRAAVSAIEIQRLVPSVAAALKLASCLECTVEELFGTARPPAKNEWAWEPHAPASRYWQAEGAGRVLYFPFEETAAG